MQQSIGEALMQGVGARLIDDNTIQYVIKVAFDTLSKYYPMRTTYEEVYETVTDLERLHDIAMMHVLHTGQDAYLVFAFDMKDARNVCSEEGVKTFCCCLTRPDLSYLGTTRYTISDGVYRILANSILPRMYPWINNSSY